MKSYAIANLSEGADDQPLLDRIATLSRINVDAIQLRARHLDDRDLLDLAIRCRRLISGSVMFLINRRADIAVAAKADGVHLPADGIPIELARQINANLVVGVSCHSVEGVQAAAASGAQLAVIGPLFEARSAPKAPAVSLSDLHAIDKDGIDVYALGGLTVEKLPILEGTGVTGVAAITMFMNDDPIEQIVGAVREAKS